MAQVCDINLVAQISDIPWAQIPNIWTSYVNIYTNLISQGYALEPPSSPLTISKQEDGKFTVRVYYNLNDVTKAQLPSLYDHFESLEDPPYNATRHQMNLQKFREV